MSRMSGSSSARRMRRARKGGNSRGSGCRDVMSLNRSDIRHFQPTNGKHLACHRYTHSVEGLRPRGRLGRAWYKGVGTMRLVPKLTLAFVAGMSLILAGNAYFRVKRELAFFETDRILGHRLIGRVLGSAVETVWKSEGSAKAMELVRQADSETTMRVRWKATQDDPVRSANEQASTYVTSDERGALNRSTFVPVAIDANGGGGLEVSESIASEQAYVRKTITDTVVTACILAVVCTLLAMVLNVWFVGRPAESLAQKARRVGQGDFSSPLHLPGKDEFTELAHEMNAMCDRLGQTLTQLRHADRLATVGKLASGLAHELGTPLNVISARAEMMAAGEASGVEIKDYSRIIMEATDRLTGIVRQLLEFARPRDLEKSRHDVAQLARQTLRLLTPDRKST